MNAVITKPQMKQMPMMPTIPQPRTIVKQKVAFGSITKSSGHRVVMYGPGGIGKTTLASNLPGPVAFFDLDESLSVLSAKLEMENVRIVDGIKSWQDLRNALQSDGWDEIKTLVIDTATKAEELCIAHTLATIKNEKGCTCTSVEGYGFGKGYTHVYESFLPLLSDLDTHCRAGRNVVLICHDCTSNVPNPAGEDWIRYEPRLQSPSSGKASIRLRVREWADHVLFLGYDVAVDEDGKGRGSGTRTLYTTELPHCMAKSRTCNEQLAVNSTEDIWKNIIK